MNDARACIRVIGCMLAASWLAVGGAAAALQQPASQNGLPDAPGKDVVERVCTSCHGAGEMTSSPRTPPAWREALELMKGYGAVATEDEWRTVTSYIMANVAFLSVNKAPAVDVGVVLDVDQKTADAIAAYRDKQGGFTSIDDLKRAPGIDEKRVDAVKARLTFEK